MAKIVVAGKANCPYYAKVELLADELSKNLPSFQLHKIVITQDTWQDWLSSVCEERGWSHKKSPLVWRELVDRGGKGVLIGDANDFQEYANGYYDLSSKLNSHDVVTIAEENKKTKGDLDEEERQRLAAIQPINVCITCANQPVAYHFIPELLTGEIFGPNTEIALNLVEEDDQIGLIEGLRMEAIDTSYPLLRSTKVTDSVSTAFTDARFIVLLDDFEKGEDETAWYRQYYDRYTEYARLLDQVASKNVKVLVACNGPINFCVEHMIKATTQLPRHNIIGVSRMVENHVKAIIGKVLKVNSANVADAIIWGNVHGERYIDINHCKARQYEGAIYGPGLYSRLAKEFLYDKKWLEKEFLEEVTMRSQELEGKLTHSNSMSRGAAIHTLLRQMVNGSGKEEMYSLALHSDGWYGVPEGMVFSYPVIFHPSGSLAVVQDIDLSEEEEGKINACVQDLKRENEMIFPPPKPPSPELEPDLEPEPTVGVELTGLDGTTVLSSIAEVEHEGTSSSDGEKEHKDETAENQDATQDATEQAQDENAEPAAEEITDEITEEIQPEEVD